MIEASRAIVDRVVDGPALVYGLNTGLGHQRDVPLPRESLREMQALIVGAHEGAVGEPLPAAVVRAAMVARLNGIARGGSGASRPMAQAFVDLLNARVHPVVPATGSIGASDLMHMAAIAQVLIGRGYAEVGGEVMPGGDALAAAGLAPIELEPKDGLTVISANGVAIGHAALLVARAERVAAAADLVLAASLEATAGNPSILDEAVLRAKPVPGQLAAGAEHPRVPRRQPAERAGRPTLGPGPAVVPGRAAGPRRVPGLRHAAPRCRAARAQRDGRQPAGGHRVGADAEQRQLPPDGARARARRPPARGGRTSASSRTGG